MVEKKDFAKIKREIHKAKREVRKKILGLDEKAESVKMRLYTEKTKTRRALTTELFGNAGKDADTSIELFVKDILDEQNLKYIPQKAIRYANYDFYLPEQNVLIEVNGCYWHVCYICYPDGAKNLIQKRNLDKNVMKREIAESKNIPLIEIWAHSIEKVPKTAKTKLLEYIEQLSGTGYSVASIQDEK